MGWLALLFGAACLCVNAEARFTYHGVTQNQQLSYTKAQIRAIFVNILCFFFFIIVQFNLEEAPAIDENPKFIVGFLFAIAYFVLIILTRVALKQYKRYGPKTKDEGKEWASSC